jgi:hypothetical protein
LLLRARLIIYGSVNTGTAVEGGRDVEDVMVGVYGFQELIFDQRTFSRDEVRAAYLRFEDLLQQLGF